MKAGIILAALLITSCGISEYDAYVCNCQQAQKVQDFIANGLRPANNMSDEEMEDVIKQLEETGVRLNCPIQRLKFTYPYSIVRSKAITNGVKMDSCFTYYVR